MGTISADADPSKFRSTGQEAKCGTCKNMIVKPPEVELARYALPIGACAPGVHCLGGAVRGMCRPLGTMVESTDMVPRTKCGGRLYVAGGPSIRGMAAAGPYLGGGSPNRIPGVKDPPDDGSLGFLLAAGAVLIPAIIASFRSGNLARHDHRMRPGRLGPTDDMRITESDEPSEWEDRPPRGPELKPGRYLRDPLHRVVTVVSVSGDSVTVRFAGPRGTTTTYPVSVLRPPVR